MRWRSQTGRVDNGRFNYLDGIRALAICAVLSLHWLSWYTPFLHGGSIGVDVFFVLSGFIITTMLWRSRGPARLGSAWWIFVKRRVIRLYPALLGLVVVAIVLYAVTPSAPLSPLEVARRGVLTLTQSSAIWAADQSGSFRWLPALHPFGQTWSLAIEWYFYLLWPLVVLGARARGYAAGRVALGSLVMAVPLYLVALPLSDFWFYFGPSARFAELLVGASLALWFQAGGCQLRPWSQATAASLAALGTIALITIFAPAAHNPLYRYFEVPATVLATVVLIYAGYSNTGGPVHRLLSHPWLAKVGRCSYSLYLWHIVPLLLLEKAGLPLSRPVLGLLAVAATIVLTAAAITSWSARSCVLAATYCARRRRTRTSRTWTARPPSCRHQRRAATLGLQRADARRAQGLDDQVGDQAGACGVEVDVGQGVVAHPQVAVALEGLLLHPGGHVDQPDATLRRRRADRLVEGVQPLVAVQGRVDRVQPHTGQQDRGDHGRLHGPEQAVEQALELREADPRAVVDGVRDRHEVGRGSECLPRPDPGRRRPGWCRHRGPG